MSEKQAQRTRALRGVTAVPAFKGLDHEPGDLVLPDDLKTAGYRLVRSDKGLWWSRGRGRNVSTGNVYALDDLAGLVDDARADLDARGAPAKPRGKKAKEEEQAVADAEYLQEGGQFPEVPAEAPTVTPSAEALIPESAIQRANTLSALLNLLPNDPRFWSALKSATAEELTEALAQVPQERSRARRNRIELQLRVLSRKSGKAAEQSRRVRENLDLPDAPPVEEVIEYQEPPNPAEAPVFDAEPLATCRVCGCTDLNACEGGCWWVEDDLCSACANKEDGEPSPEELAAISEVEQEQEAEEAERVELDAFRETLDRLKAEQAQQLTVLVAKTPRVEHVAVGKLRLEWEAQSRVSISEETIDNYQADFALYGGWGRFPPVKATSVDGMYFVYDGYQRVTAYKRDHALSDLVPVQVIEGGYRDAILLSVGANFDHGLRRSRADAQNAVTKLLKDGEWRQWSDAEIARHAKVDPKTVGNIRRRLEANREIPDTLVRKTADGHTVTRKAEPIAYAPVWLLENAVGAFFDNDLVGRGDDPLENKLSVLMYMRSDPASHGDFLTLQKRLPEHYRKSDLIQAINNVRDQRRQAKLRASSKAVYLEPTAQPMIPEVKALLEPSPEPVTEAVEPVVVAPVTEEAPPALTPTELVSKLRKIANDLADAGDIMLGDLAESRQGWYHDTVLCYVPAETDPVLLAAAARTIIGERATLAPAVPAPDAPSLPADANERWVWLPMLPSNPTNEQRVAAATDLLNLYRAALKSLSIYGELTGRFTDTTALQRCLTSPVEGLKSFLAALGVEA